MTNKKYPDGGKVKKYQSGTSETATNLGRNVASYFLGVKNTSLQPSQYKPSKSTDPSAKYNTWQYLKNDVKTDITGETYLNNINIKEANLSRQNTKYLPSYVKEGNFDQLYNYYENARNANTVSGSSVNLGHYQVSSGKDDRGRYFGIYDKYDWNLLEGVGMKGNSWETYDRIYEDEWEKIPTKNKKSKMPDGGKIKNKEKQPDVVLPKYIRKASQASREIPDVRNSPTGMIPWHLPSNVEPKKGNSKLEQVEDIEQQAWDIYESTSPKKYSFNDTNRINLTKGTMNTGNVSKDVLTDLVSAADRVGIPRNTMLAIAGQESMFGEAAGRRNQQEIVSGWDAGNAYTPTNNAQFFYSKGVPNIKLHKDKRGYNFVRNNNYDKSLDSALNIHPEWIEEYRQAQNNVVPQGDINYFDEMARIAKNQGLGRINPGDPDYPNKVKRMEGYVGSDPAIQRIYQEYDNTTKNKTNMWDGGKVKTKIKNSNINYYQNYQPQGNPSVDLTWDGNNFQVGTNPDGTPIWGNPIQDQPLDLLQQLNYGNIPTAESGIHIKPENKGKFTSWAKKHGMSVQKAASHVMANKEDYAPHVISMANFSLNSSKWNKAEFGATLPQYDIGNEYEIDEKEAKRLRSLGYKFKIIK